MSRVNAYHTKDCNDIKVLIKPNENLDCGLIRSTLRYVRDNNILNKEFNWHISRFNQLTNKASLENHNKLGTSLTRHRGKYKVSNVRAYEGDVLFVKRKELTKKFKEENPLKYSDEVESLRKECDILFDKINDLSTKIWNLRQENYEARHKERYDHYVDYNSYDTAEIKSLNEELKKLKSEDRKIGTMVFNLESEQDKEYYIKMDAVIDKQLEEYSNNLKEDDCIMTSNSENCCYYSSPTLTSEVLIKIS